MKTLPALCLLLRAIGCHTTETPHHGKLYFVDGGYVRQWVYEDGSLCGEYQGRQGGTYLATPEAVWASQRHFLRESDAKKYIEQFCPNAVPAPPEELK